MTDAGWRRIGCLIWAASAVLFTVAIIELIRGLS